jgi:hypothetical protein
MAQLALAGVGLSFWYGRACTFLHQQILRFEILQVDTCLLEAEKFGPGAVSIKQRLLEMRTCRKGLIQTEEQLKFSYQSIIEVWLFQWI